MRANSHHKPPFVAAIALQIGVATTTAVGPAQARPSSSYVYACSGWKWQDLLRLALEDHHGKNEVVKYEKTDLQMASIYRQNFKKAPAKGPFQKDLATKDPFQRDPASVNDRDSMTQKGIRQV
ncbi:hypothetical protein Tco_0145187 [Tanacetum coccineum]